MLMVDPRLRPSFPKREAPRNRAIVDAGGVWLHTEYTAEFVDAIKASFDWYNRYWEPSRTAWRVEGPENVRSALGLFKTFFPEGVIIDG